MGIEILRRGQLKNAKQPQDWIWDGLIGPRSLTLFTSVCKTGKTTLLAHLLSQRKEACTFVGRALRPGTGVVVSEEEEALWEERDERLGFRDDACFICRPFAVAPKQERWEHLIDLLLGLQQSDGVDLAIIDSLGYFLPPGAENLASMLIAALMPLHRLTAAGMAVVLVHHPRKERSQPGMNSRGSSLLPGFADIIMEMYPRTPGKLDDRQRRLLSFSRFNATPRVLLFELSEDGRTMIPNEEPPPEDEFLEHWRVLRLVMEDARHQLTRQEIEAQWPSTYLQPKETKLYELLNEAFDRGLVRIEGAGRRADPFRYYLPEKLEEWKADPIYALRQKMKESQDLVERNLGQFLS